MKKPSNYDATQVSRDFTPIEAGGHICVIKQVEEVNDKNGKSMLKISLDTDTTDKQPSYFAESFKNDIRPDKKWGCVMYLGIDESTDYGTKNLKTFCTSVEESNTGFSVQWEDKFSGCFKSKKVGVVFGREQYLNDKGEIKWSTKPKWFRSTGTVLNAKVPDDKYLSGCSAPIAGVPSSDGFMNIPSDLELEELPFN